MFTINGPLAKNAGMVRRSALGALGAAVLSAAVFACAGTPKQGAEPAWVSDPYAAYNKAAAIAAVGYGPSRDMAEKSALASLTAIFGQSVSSEQTSGYSYSQAVAASSSVWSEKSDIAQAVKTSTAMDTLIGAEIKDVWKSADGTCYAAAVMDRAKANLVYAELMQQNQSSIDRLVNVSAGEKQSFEGFVNYYRAANLADANQVFATVRNVISPGSMAGEILKSGNDYRLEAAQIAKNIPIAVNVDNDRQDRIKGAFADVLSAAGFRTGGNGSRYVLKVQLVLEEVSYANNPYRWIRYVVDANLADTAAGTVLFPYNINDRTGHSSISEAENRAIRSAEEAIKNGYLAALGNFLSGNVKK